ncbi:MAG TPA: amidohydrolase family protein, partial [Bacteroidia bacterium]|nr:amidohydrolase family protein [Bacteroidia bacterium]
EMGDYLRLNIIRGITTLRSMRGDAKHPALRDSIRQGYITGPTLYLGSPVLPSDKDLNPELAAKLIHQYKQEGFDFIKYLWPLKPAMFDTVLAIAAREGIRVAGHAPKAGLEAALQNKEASVEHIDAFLELYKKDSVKFRQVVHKLGDAGIFSCPDVQWYYLAWNQLALEQLEVRNGMNCIAPAVKEKWEMEFKMNFAEHMKNRAEFVKQRNAHRKDLEMTARMIKAMQEEGIPLLLSPGDGAFIIPGYSMLDECRNFAEAGISPFEVLKAGTVNPASFCHWESGKVEPGKRADLVLLENNPLENVESLDHIQGVMVRGKWFSKDDLEKMEQEIRDRYNRQK